MFWKTSKKKKSSIDSISESYSSTDKRINPVLMKLRKETIFNIISHNISLPYLQKQVRKQHSPTLDYSMGNAVLAKGLPRSGALCRFTKQSTKPIFFPPVCAL